MDSERRFRADIILIAALLLAGGIIAGILLSGSSKGGTVVVKVDGETVKELPLNENATFEITGSGGGSNILVVQDGSAWMEEANCPDKLCVKMGKISRTGQSIVCLPHKVVIEIAGAGSPDVDVYVK